MSSNTSLDQHVIRRVKNSKSRKSERENHVNKNWSREKNPTVELRLRLGNEGVVEVMRRGRLRWFGHFEQKEVDDWVSACRNLEVAGSRGRGKPRMTWRAQLDGDMKEMVLRPGMQ